MYITSFEQRNSKHSWRAPSFRVQRKFMLASELVAFISGHFDSWTT